MDHTANEFLVEIEDHVEQIYVDLDQLRGIGTDGPGRRAVIDRIFRRVHSVKGSGATGGLQVVSQIAHEFENLLDAARTGRIVLDDAALAICESATDAMSESLRLAAAGIVEPSRRDLFSRLQAATQATAFNSNVGDEAIVKRIPETIWQSLTDAEKHRLVSALKEDSQLFKVSASFEVLNFDEEFVRLKEALAQRGEIITTSPAVDHARPDKINFLLLYASSLVHSALVADLKASADVTVRLVENPGVMPALGSGSSSGALSSTPSSVSSLANFVRTDLDTLDRIISSTHETFRRTSNALDQVLAGKDEVHKQELQKTNDELKAAFLGVEDELINLRMVSLSPTLQRAARSGKTAARLAGKEINFEVIGGDLRLDKLLADAIADPLIHMVRNAVDHGIEPVELRAQAGKNKCGTVRIQAMSQGGRTLLRVADDGRGIDPNLISAAATKLGILESETELDIDRSLRLIFRPGFTTAGSVSDLSGRGVGLDVVETMVEQAGGEIRVSSTAGLGTTFEIRLPVTFGLMEARVIVCAGRRYCLPANQTEIRQKSDLELTDELLPQNSLRELLGHPASVTQTVSSRDDSYKSPIENSSSDSKTLTFQISNGAENENPKSVEIQVDEIAGTEKVLVRGLGRHSGRWYGVAGATELSDGSIALVLDLPRLLNHL